ncbi:MAG: FtsX-like permease family protein [Ruminococcus sp.]|nr:FtsX-like permease family protein [Ruminococcus sp.]
MEVFTLVKANIKRRKGAFIAVILLTAIIVSSSLSIFNFIDSMDRALERSFSDRGDPTEVCFVYNKYYTPQLEDKVRSLDIVKKLEVYDALDNWYNDGVSNRVGNSNDGNSYFYMKLHDGIRLINSDVSGFEDSIPALEKGEVYLPLGCREKLRCKLGDTLETCFYYKKYEFTIKGFVQEPQNGSTQIGWKQVFISDDDFDELTKISAQTKADPAYKNDRAVQSGIEVKVFNTYKSPSYEGSDAQFQRDVNLATRLGDLSSGTLTRAQSVNYSSLAPNVLSKIVLTFIAVLFVVALVIMGHSISSEIEIDRKKLGILKSQGFTTRKIRLIMQIQYILAMVIGIILGIVGSFFLSGLIASEFANVVGTPVNIRISFLKAVLVISALIGISLLVMAIKTHKVTRISPVQAITGQKGDVYFDSRLKMGLSKKLLSLTLGIRQFTSAKRRYISMLIISALLMYFMVSINLIAGLVTSSSSLEMMGMEVTQIDMNINNAGEDLLTIEEAEKRAEEIIEKYTTIEKRYAVNSSYCAINGYKLFCRAYKYPQDIGGLFKGRRPRQKNEILITQLVSDEFGWKIGDKVNVTSSGGELECMVTGIYQSMNDAGMVFAIPYEAFETLNPSFKITYEGFVIKDESKAKQIADEIDKALVNDKGEKKGSCSYWDIHTEGDEMYESEINLLKTIIYGFSGVFMLVAVVLLCTKAFVLERRDIGIYKAIGFTSARLRLSFALRFSFVAFLGSLIGFALSALFTQKMMETLLRVIGLCYLELDIGVLDIVIPMALLISGFFIFSLVASRKIKKVETRELVAE